MRDNKYYDEVCLTLDIDWAPEPVVEIVVEMLSTANVRATFFATHDSPALLRLDPQKFEVGLHPNFNNVTNGDYDDAVRKLKALYPAATGARSHGLFVSTAILQRYMEHGLKYESNIFMPLHGRLHPVTRFKELISIPFYWSDDKHLSLSDSFSVNDLGLRALGLKVYNFHPMHIFMNTHSDQHYQSYKKHYQNYDALLGCVNNTRPGIGTQFRALLGYLNNSGAPLRTMEQISDQFMAENE